MRYVISSSQLSHFRKEKTIDLEELYSKKELENLKELFAANPFDRDPQRNNPPLLSALHTSRLGQVASALCGKKRVRIAFVQKAPFPRVHMSVEELSPLSEILCACLMHLDEGQITFVFADTVFDFAALSEEQILIAFASDQARYKYQELDPHAHDLKKMGYGFGDRVSQETHPLIHR